MSVGSQTQTIVQSSDQGTKTTQTMATSGGSAPASPRILVSVGGLAQTIVQSSGPGIITTQTVATSDGSTPPSTSTSISAGSQTQTSVQSSGQGTKTKTVVTSEGSSSTSTTTSSTPSTHGWAAPQEREFAGRRWLSELENSKAAYKSCTGLFQRWDKGFRQAPAALLIPANNILWTSQIMNVWAFACGVLSCSMNLNRGGFGGWIGNLQWGMCSRSFHMIYQCLSLYGYWMVSWKSLELNECRGSQSGTGMCRIFLLGIVHAVTRPCKGMPLKGLEVQCKEV